jgi:hypothetical protein
MNGITTQSPRWERNTLDAKIFCRTSAHILPIARRIFSGEIGSDLTRAPIAS